MNKEEIKNSKKITRFINSIPSKNSRVRYEYFIKEFFLFINENPDKYLVDDYEFLELIDKKKIANKYKNDLKDFKNKLLNEPNKRGRDNKEPSIRTTLSCIKSLFTYCEIDFPITFWQNLNNFKNNRTSVTETPTPEQLRKILDHTDLQGKCIFLIMATSGSRIDSVIQLKRKDIDMNYEFPRITFSYLTAKNGITKLKRVSPECKRFLESYFINNTFTPDSRLFRMTRQNADYKWKCALKKAGLYKESENTGRATMTTHCLKRFFMTNFSKANFGNNEQWANYFGEHISDLDRRYKDFDEKFIDEQYSKGVQYLLVYEKSYDTDSRILQLQKDHEIDKGTIKFLTDKVSILDNSLDVYERQNETMEQKHEKEMKNLKDELITLKGLILKNSHNKDESLYLDDKCKPHIKFEGQFVDVSQLEWKTEKLTNDFRLKKVKK
jgi:integrase